MSLLVAVVDYDRVGGNEMIGGSAMIQYVGNDMIRGNEMIGGWLQLKFIIYLIPNVCPQRRVLNVACPQRRMSSMSHSRWNMAIISKLISSRENIPVDWFRCALTKWLCFKIHKYVNTREVLGTSGPRLPGSTVFKKYIYCLPTIRWWSGFPVRKSEQQELCIF